MSKPVSLDPPFSLTRSHKAIVTSLSVRFWLFLLRLLLTRCGMLIYLRMRFLQKNCVKPSFTLLKEQTVNVLSFSEQENVAQCLSGKSRCHSTLSLPQQKLHVNISLCHCSSLETESDGTISSQVWILSDIRPDNRARQSLFARSPTLDGSRLIPCWRN